MNFLGLKDENTNVKKEILSGMTVAITLLPEVIAFSFVLGVDPMVGIWSAIIIGFITSLFGGRPGLVSGAAGAVAVVYASLVDAYGIEYLYLAVICSGLLQVLFGYLNLSKLIRLVPHSVMLGFLNGLAIVILMSQIDMFKDLDGNWLVGIEMLAMISLVLLTCAIIYFAPKFTKVIPGTLLAIIVVTLISFAFKIAGVQIYTIGEYAGGSLSGEIPRPHIPDVPWTLETFRIIIPFAFTAAFVGLLESLLTLGVVDEITDTKGDTKKESIAQGLANIASGFFGGMGGCAMVGQTMVNMESGGSKYLSSFMAAVTLLAIALFLAPIIEIVPLAALTGVMIMVVISTFAWETIYLSKYFPKSDLFIVFVVTVVTVTHDLAMGVIVGVIISTLIFAWNKSENIRVNKIEGKYFIEGALFFGSTTKFKDELVYNEKKMILDFQEAKIVDYSAVNLMSQIADKCKDNEIEIVLDNLDHDSYHKLVRSNVDHKFTITNNAS